MTSRKNIQDIYPLSVFQKEAYRLATRPTEAGNTQVSVRFEGALDTDRLSTCFREACKQHEVTRSVFYRSSQGKLLQVVYNERPRDVGYEDLTASRPQADAESQLRDAKRKYRDQALNPKEGLLIHLTVLKTGASLCEVLFTYHPLVMDDRSAMKFITALFTMYCDAGNDTAGINSPAEAGLYKSFLNSLERIDQQAAKRYWAGRLSEVPVAFEMPLRGGHKTTQDSLCARLDATHTKLLRAAAARWDIAQEDLFRLSWALVMGKYNDTQHIIFGSTHSYRDDLNKNIVGMFSKVIPVEVQFETTWSWDELMRAYKKLVVDQRPFQLVDWTSDETNDNSCGQLQNVILTIDDFSLNQPVDNKIQYTVSDVHRSALHNGSFTCQVTLTHHTLLYCKNTIHDPAAVRSALDLFRKILIKIATCGDATTLGIRDLMKVDAVEESRLLTMSGSTKDYPLDKTIDRLFEEQALKTPDAIALVFEGREFSYKTLDERSNQLARLLRTEKDVKPDDIVGIMLNKSDSYFVAVLGILKAGGAFLSLDPTYPAERNDYILTDAGISLMITDSSLMFSAGNYQGSLVVLDIELPAFTEAPAVISKAHTARNLAYVIYTSGSTGHPKGVQIEHRSLVNLSCWHCESFGISTTSRATLYSELGFDASVWEVWPYMINGACIYIIDQATRLDIPALIDLLTVNRITHCFLPTALYEQLPATADLGGVTIFTGGDRLRKIGNENTHLVNNYGPTEGTVVSTSVVLHKPDADTIIPIGKPIANMRVFVLDEDLQMKPQGAIGELCIGGAGIARGYLGKEELTRQKFVINPYNPSELMYRTGDYGRLRGDGNIEFIGRKDSQIKLRGYRIEAAEIEKRLLDISGIRHAVVVLKESNSAGPVLVGYLQVDDIPDEHEIRRELAHHLPAYMIPAKFVRLKSFPLTSRGKIQYSALPHPDQASVSDVPSGGEPTTAAETTLAKIWRDVLGISRIGITDDFFESGGHSLKAIQLIAAIHHEFGVKLKLTDIFSNTTLRAMAGMLENATQRDVEEIVPIDEQPYYEASHAQRQIWLACQMDGHARSYNLLHTYDLEGHFDIGACEKAFRTIIQRHESLRTTFVIIDGELRQQVNNIPYDAFGVNFQDIQHTANTRDTLEQHASKASEKIFDLQNGPLVEVDIFRTGASSHVLFLNMHHIITDGWSMEVLANEFASLYHAFTKQGEVLLPTPGLQYKDFAAWQNKQLKLQAFNKHREYWQDVFRVMPQPLNLPADLPRGNARSTEGSSVEFSLSHDTSVKLERLANLQGTTLYMTVLSLLNVLLCKYCNQHDIVIGSPVAGRDLDHTQDQVGVYMNILPIRNHIHEKATFHEFLKTVKENVLQAYEHQHYPFDLIAENAGVRRDSGRSPVFDVGFTWQNTTGVVPGKNLSTVEGLTINVRAAKITQVKTDLWLMGWVEGNQLLFSLGYNTDLYRPATIGKMVRDFKALIEILIQQPDTEIAILITSSESKQTETKTMANTSKEKNLEKFFNTPRKSTRREVSDITESYFDSNTKSPLIIQPAVDGLILSGWVADNKTYIENKLLTHGGILFRGFNLSSPESFQEVSRALSPRQMIYTNRSSPRSKVAANLYTSTDHPADQVIHMHNELSYSHTWPMQILFFCYLPSPVRGETPIADSRQVLAGLSPGTVEKFRARGVKYVRNMVQGIGLSWQDVYQTTDPLAVEDYCTQNNIDFEWINSEHLRISWNRPAVLKHPVSGEETWFNHGYFYSPFNLEATLYEVLNKEGNLPFCTYYGDGTSIEHSVVTEIHEVYERTKVVFPWVKGDLLLLDNMLMAHGRNPFEGDRKILVAMNEPHSDTVAISALSY